MSNTPLSAIHAFCITCFGDQPRMVKDCPSKNCPLWPFRQGRNTLVKHQMTDEQRQAAAERMKKAREAKNSN